MMWCTVMKRLENILERIRTIRNWWDFIFPFNRIGPRKRIAYLRSGARIVLRDPFSSDFAGILDIASRDVYGLSAIKDAKRIVDVGANIGVFSVLAARRFPAATVYALEPEEQNFSLLKENIALNGLTNVVPLRKAAAKQHGTARLYLGAPDSHSLYGSGLHTEVETVPLSDFGDIDFLKIDAEGAERDILPSSAHTIAVEVHGDEPEKFVRSLGRPYRETHRHVYVISDTQQAL